MRVSACALKEVVITLASDINVKPIIKAEAVEAVRLGVLLEFSVANFPKIPNIRL